VDKITALKRSVAKETISLATSPPSERTHIGQSLKMLSPVTPDEVNKIIMSIPAKSSPLGFIPTSLMKDLLFSFLIAISQPLSHCDRLRGKGGSVCAYVRSSITCSVFVPGVGAQSRVNDVEILWLDCTLHDCHYFVACCYHPPKLKYNYSVFIDILSSDIDYINSMYRDAVIIVAGDFNQLKTSFLDVDHGLVQMVSRPTHCDISSIR